MMNSIVDPVGQQASCNKDESLKRIIPICSCCHKIHVDKKFWKQLEMPLAVDVDAALSHGLCPGCYEEQRREFIKFKSGKILNQTPNVVNFY